MKNLTLAQASFSLNHTSSSMVLRSKFVTSYVQSRGITHFLAIPLMTPTSRTQVSDSFKCLWDALAAIDVPTDAIRPLGLLHLNLDIPLSLKTLECMAKATEILRNVSNKKTLPTMHESSTSGSLSRHSSSALPTSNCDINNSMASPCVSISGLFCSPGNEAKVLNLSTKVYDPTHRVRNWKLRLVHTYQAAVLSPKQYHPKELQKRAAMKKLLASCDATVRLIHMPTSTEVAPCKWKPGKLIHPRLNFIDVRGLLERYKDHVWVENAPLESSSICRLGFHKLVAEELPEVLSVPLS